jgi:hypothetical protein
MIGADDLQDFYDPEEFGCTVQLIEVGQKPRSVNGMWGAPVAFGRMQRSGSPSTGATLRVKPGIDYVQLPNDELPADHTTTKVVADDAEYSITEIAPLGRLRSLLTLVPYGDRAARQGDEKSNGWLPTKPRAV